MPDPAPGLAEQLFQSAADLPKDQRAAFLDANCGDPALRQEVESLLAHFDAPTDDCLRTWSPDSGRAPGDHSPGELIANRYKLHHVLGEGGLGIVWLAMQKEPVPRRVALKLIKPGMDSKEILGRFDAERNALAIMDHPNIARVHDAGMTAKGQPFFAMEYVEGVPVTGFCDTECLRTEERLAVFIDICSAVQHAHQKGVIHRDLKPSNILVTMHEGQPVPKVIDFGIAKATSQDLTAATIFTMPGQMIGTPEYMSPEQAEMSTVGVDSTTDIYSLGVVLYELLTGELPFPARELRQAGLIEIQRRIREDDPPKPSTRVSTLGDKTSRVSAHRGTDARTLRSQLRGDLDWIVMKALEKQRTRRYASASEFAADVGRFLRHEPVLARRPSRVYKIRKFARRNRTAVVAGALVLLALCAGVVGTTLAMLEAERLREDADAAAISARSSTRAMADLIGLANTDLTKDPNLTMRDLLTQAQKLLDSGTLVDRAAEATVRGAIGRARFALGDFREAGEQIVRALALHEDSGGGPSRERYELGWNHAWITYDKHGGGNPHFQAAINVFIAGALPSFDQVSGELRAMVVDIYKQTLKSNFAEDGERFYLLEYAAPWRDDYVDGPSGTQKLIRDFVALADENATTGDPQFWQMVADQLVLAGWWTAFDVSHGKKARLDAGIDFIEQGIRIYVDPRRGGLPESNTRVIAARRRLWEIGWVLDRPKLAQDNLEKSLASADGVAPKDHWYFAWCQMVVSVYLVKNGEHDRAVQIAMVGFRKLRRILGDEHDKVLHAAEEVLKTLREGKVSPTIATPALFQELESYLRKTTNAKIDRLSAELAAARRDHREAHPEAIEAARELLTTLRHWDFSDREDAAAIEKDLVKWAALALDAALADPHTDVWKLSDGAWHVVVRSQYDAATYGKALRCAQRILIAERSHFTLNTFGVCQFRAGKYPEAIATFGEAIHIRGAAEVNDLAYQAMAEFHLGRPAWRTTMARLEELMKRPEVATDMEQVRAAREARAVCR